MVGLLVVVYGDIACITIDRYAIWKGDEADTEAIVDGHSHNTACTSVGISREAGVGWT